MAKTLKQKFVQRAASALVKDTSARASALAKNTSTRALAHFDDKAAAYERGVLTVGVVALALGGGLHAYRVWRDLED